MATSLAYLEISPRTFVPVSLQVGAPCQLKPVPGVRYAYGVRYGNTNDCARDRSHQKHWMQDGFRIL
ncbi:MAG: hypothetical protein P4L92_01040 [Rudaea sp.]|nr:hypothetical protein [Rudaea sp.]